MWSGGLDSTYGLVRTLSESSAAVFVHHLHRMAPPDRLSDQDAGKKSEAVRYEAESCERMRVIFRERYRPFVYSESLVDLTAFPVFARDAATVMLTAGLVARQLGFAPDDEILDVMNSDEDTDWDLSQPGGQDLRRIMQRILECVWQSDKVPRLSVLEPVLPKRHQVAYLSADIVALNASCRAPVFDGATWQRCGRCRKCRSYSAMGLQADGRIDPAAAVPAPPQQPEETEHIIEFRKIGRRRSLVMWSGGPASTAALALLLRDTDDEVHVHHIRSSGRPGGHADEIGFGGHAQTEIKTMFADLRRKLRSFSASVSTMGPLSLVQLTHPVNIASYFAAQGAMTWRMTRNDRVVFGSYGQPNTSEAAASATQCRSGRSLAPQMLKAIMRSGDIPEVWCGQDLRHKNFATTER